MVVLYVFLCLIALAIIVCSGIICGRICAEIVHNKSSKTNQVLWFWFGFLFTYVAVLCTLAVKDERK